MDRDQLHAVAEELQGTCNTLDDALEGHSLTEDDMSKENHADLAEITQLCETCGWWCEPCEMEEGECEDCINNRQLIL